MRKWVKHPTTSVIRKYFASEASSVKCIENGVTMCIFLHKEIGYPCWHTLLKRMSLCAFFANKKNSACPCWPTLVKGRFYMYFYKKLGVLVGLPDWKWRHYVQFCKSNCMSLLVYPSERASLCIFCKRKLCVLVSLPYWKGRYYVHFLQKKNACFYWPTLLKRASLCAFFAKKHIVCVSLSCWKGRHYVHFCNKKKRLCPRWPTLLKAASLRALVFSNKKLMCS